MNTEVTVVCLLALAVGSLAISFRLEPEVRKCIKEEVHKDVLVVGEYRLSDMPGQRTDLVVRVMRELARDTLMLMHWDYGLS